MVRVGLFTFRITRFRTLDVRFVSFFFGRSGGRGFISYIFPFEYKKKSFGENTTCEQACELRNKSLDLPNVTNLKEGLLRE